MRGFSTVYQKIDMDAFQINAVGGFDVPLMHMQGLLGVVDPMHGVSLASEFSIRDCSHD